MSEQRTARRRIAATAMAIGVVLLGIGVAPGVASAHTPNVSDNCGGLSVALTSYEGGSTNNQVVVTIDGASQTFNFGTSFSQSFTWPSTSNHSWTVVIDANRTNGGNATLYDTSFSGTQVACTPTTSTSSTTTTTTTTTTTLPSSTTTTTEPESTTTQPGSSTTTVLGSTTTVEQAGPSTSVGQQGPTSTVDQSSGAAATTTDQVGGALPATGAGDGSASLTVIALTLIGIGAVMLRLASRPSR